MMVSVKRCYNGEHGLGILSQTPTPPMDSVLNDDSGLSILPAPTDLNIAPSSHIMLTFKTELQLACIAWFTSHKNQESVSSFYKFVFTTTAWTTNVASGFQSSDLSAGTVNMRLGVAYITTLMYGSKQELIPE
ncbi:hypothetical protein VNO77_22958 [Canavalia gladiata]|uniref:Uncharacterized protein n=1 Tax=Canavalia gladiata TaxID=3824 RepID=A0AAN9QBA1_CANGL